MRNSYFRLAEYLARNTRRPVGIVLGIKNIRDLFDRAHYEELQGGLLEAMGRLFKDQIRLFVYPALEDGHLVTAETLELEAGVDTLYRFLLAQGTIRPMRDFDKDHLWIQSEEALALIRQGDERFASMVPEQVAEAIRDQKLLGFGK